MKTQPINIDWWKLNTFGILFTIIIVLIDSLITSGQISLPIIIMSVFGLLFAYGFWKKSKLLFFFVFISSLISLVQTLLSIFNGTYSITIMIFSSIISYVLIFGLAWQVIIKKK